MMPRAEFSQKTKRLAYERSKGFCERCGAPLANKKVEFHHVYGAPSGRAGVEDCEVLCVGCHRQETATVTIPTEAKIKRVRDRHLGLRRKGRGFRGWRKFDGTRVWKNDR